MKTQKFYVFADNRGKLYYSTSPGAFVRFSIRNVEMKTAIFSGITDASKKHLRRLGAGVYEKNKERREK